MSLNQVKLDKYPNTVVENAIIDSKYNDTATRMSEAAIYEFLNNICSIDHCSGNCEEISKYLYDWAKNHNLEPVIDDSLNVYWDVKASPGCEDWPKLILQTHTDMVWETSSKEAIPTSNVDAVYEEDTGKVHSKDYKTTLGADPGQGIITLLELSKDYGFKHGPLRMIFTSDEETTMSGALALNKDVIDSDFMLNIDGRQLGVARIFSCGVYGSIFKKKFITQAANYDSEIEIKIEGLLGGHSANSIILKRVSALDVLRRILNKLNEENIKFNLVSLEGGKNRNTIPSASKMKLCCMKNDVDVIEKYSTSILDELMDESLDDKNGSCLFEVSKSNSEVFSSDDLNTIVQFLNIFKYQIYDMNEEMPGIPKNSLNFAIAKIVDGYFEVQLKYRFGDADFLEQIKLKDKNAASDLGISMEVSEMFPAWYPSKDRTLLNAYVKSAKEVCDLDLIVNGTHGGLEVGVFLDKHPGLQCISFGSDVADEHAVIETFYAKSLPPHFAILINMLENFH